MSSFIVSYSPGGVLIDAIPISCNSCVIPVNFDIDTSNNIIVSGSYNQPPSDIINVFPQSQDGFITKLVKSNKGIYTLPATPSSTGHQKIITNCSSDPLTVSIMPSMTTYSLSPDASLNLIWNNQQWSASLSFSYITSTSGLLAYYTGESWSGSKWFDLSGNSNHATSISGSISTGNINGYTYLAADSTSSSIVFPAGILPSTSYTLFHLTRKPNGETSRIFASQSATPAAWLSGFNGTFSGVAYHGNWITSTANQIGTGWILSTDQHNLYKCNKVNKTQGAPAASYALSPIGLNAYSEVGIWNSACVIVYNRILTSSEIINIENEIAGKYNLGF